MSFKVAVIGGGLGGINDYEILLTQPAGAAARAIADLA